MNKLKINELGQTSVEYILLLAVLVFMIMSVMSRIKDGLIGGTIPCPPDDQALGCVITRSVSSFGTASTGDNGPTYRYFRLRK